MNCIEHTDFQFSGQTKSYHGKVRDMYTIGDDLMVAVVSDRISAFDVVMPRTRARGCCLLWSSPSLFYLCSPCLQSFRVVKHVFVLGNMCLSGSGCMRARTRVDDRSK